MPVHDVHLPVNHIHHALALREATHALHSSIGGKIVMDDGYKKIYSLQRRFEELSTEFILHGSGVFVRNFRAIGEFNSRLKDPRYLLLSTPQVVVLRDGNTMEQLRLLDLRVMVGRQLVDIQHGIGTAKDISGRAALYRGLAQAHVLGLGIELSRIEPCLLDSPFHERMHLRVTDATIEWLWKQDLKKVLTPTECLVSNFGQP